MNQYLTDLSNTIAILGNYPIWPILGIVTTFALLSIAAVVYLTFAKKKLSTSASTSASTSESKKIEHTLNWQQKVFIGLTRTRKNLSESLSNLFDGKKLEQELLEEIHEILFRADIGVVTADYLTEQLKKSFGNQDQPKWHDVRAHLQEQIVNMITLKKQPMEHEPALKVTLIVGVNGVGKTTSIGKLANLFLSQDEKVILCAADTYRAAAIDQIKVWGERLGIDVIAHQQGSDPAAVAFDGVKAAIARKANHLLVDTAGRLHNKKELMDELQKISRVLGKDLPGAPHDTWLVIDATTGQNAYQQVRAFNEVTKLTGIIVTKLDGTAKGGILVGLCHEFQIPICYIGVGEQANDLRELVAEDFARSLLE